MITNLKNICELLGAEKIENGPYRQNYYLKNICEVLGVEISQMVPIDRTNHKTNGQIIFSFFVFLPRIFK